MSKLGVNRRVLVAFVLFSTLAARHGMCQSRPEFKEPEPATPQVFRMDALLRENIKLAQKLTGHIGKITEIACTRDGKQAITCSDDKTLRFWNLADGSEVWKAIDFDGKLNSVAVSDDAKLAVTGGFDNHLFVCNLENGTIAKTLSGAKNPLVEVRISPDGKFAAAIDEQGIGYAWDLSGGDCSLLS